MRRKVQTYTEGESGLPAPRLLNKRICKIWPKPKPDVIFIIVEAGQCWKMLDNAGVPG